LAGSLDPTIDRTNGKYPVALIHSRAEANNVHDHENLSKADMNVGRWDPMCPDHVSSNQEEIMKRKKAFGVLGLTVPKRVQKEEL
jgi:hypothetical protein